MPISYQESAHVKFLLTHVKGNNRGSIYEALNALQPLLSDTDYDASEILGSVATCLNQITIPALLKQAQDLLPNSIRKELGLPTKENSFH